MPKKFVQSALSGSARTLIGVGVFSGAINILALTGAIYMLQVYDRVIPSRSIPTLIGLTLVLVLLFAANGILDVLRSRVMSRIGVRVDEELRGPTFKAIQEVSIRTGRTEESVQAIRDMDRMRTFFSSNGPAALFDLPWIPIYLVLIFILHPLLGLFAVGGASLLVLIAGCTEWLTRRPSMAASASGLHRASIASSTARNAEVIQAMGLQPQLAARWNAASDAYLRDQMRASDVAGSLGVVSKSLRLFLQSGILGLGAYLAVKGEVSAGGIIAGSIVMSRALTPIETAIQHWRGFVDARQAAARVRAVLGNAQSSAKPASTRLPKPQRSISVENLSIAHAGQSEPTVRNVSFRLDAGDALGIIGPSGSGKSTLAKALVGVLRPHLGVGAVRLDGAALDQWSEEELGRHIGYLPQDVQLFDGTIAENISRMDRTATDEGVIEAANDAGAHNLIVNLPDGYRTRLVDGGIGLSAGQRQRIALARALYGRPFLVVLDEPNSNLDSEGDAALSAAIKKLRDRGAIAVIVAHRPSALLHVDKVMTMAFGQMVAIGPKEETLRKVLTPVPQPVQTAANPLVFSSARSGSARSVQSEAGDK